LIPLFVEVLSRPVFLRQRQLSVADLFFFFPQGSKSHMSWFGTTMCELVGFAFFGFFRFRLPVFVFLREAP
jgi:hypothetical protein